ncbi:hypothetical protein [Saccharothrix sp. NRRL B-16314]|uniref:hypothetical protein n=1 Tax=Saccharothrix sp. NRRL B-16314 TaxID=1463825 RepID=UPI00069141EF|nr:hypothetical protein [Saccharothrix sp. NRRL B-16314]
MFDERWAVVPARPVATRWATRRAEKLVLGVVHNVTAATRLFDVLPLIATDPRIQVLVACTGSSPFTPGTVEHLARLGVMSIDWAQAERTPFDLAVAAGYGGPLERLRAPLAVLPHGMGYNKYLEIGDRRPVFGLSAEWLTRDGRLIPSSVVLSHDEQLERLRLSCPEAVPVAVVAGDPCFDRMLASRPLRHTYRAALGVRSGQRLVVVSSTWGPGSLYDEAADVVRRLRVELPLDEYQVALALHPNTWFGHSRWQVRMWLAECERAGVVVLPPEEGWRASLVAADVVVGDHGSVTFYGAALGVPVLLATAAHDAVDPASAVGRFIAKADRLVPHRPLRRQLDAAKSNDEVSEIAALVSSVPGQSATLLRAEFHRLLRLAEPESPPEVRTLPVDRITTPPVVHQWVRVEFDTPDRAEVVRFPVDLRRCSPPDSHLVVGVDTPDATLLESAEIVVQDHEGDAERWIAAMFDALPGLGSASMPDHAGRWLVGTQDGTLLAFSGPTHVGRVWASVVHAWQLLATPFPAQVTVTLGDEEHTAEVRQLRAASR